MWLNVALIEGKKLVRGAAKSACERRPARFEEPVVRPGVVVRLGGEVVRERVGGGHAL
jgi:hypothetical protein